MGSFFFLKKKNNQTQLKNGFYQLVHISVLKIGKICWSIFEFFLRGFTNLNLHERRTDEQVTPGHNGHNDEKIDAWSTGPFAPPFARSLAPLTRSLALHCSLRSLAALTHSLARSLTRSWARGTVEYFCPIFQVS